MKIPNALINSDYGPIIVNSNDSVIGKQIAQQGYWAKDDIELIKQLIELLLSHKEKIIFDWIEFMSNSNNSIQIRISGGEPTYWKHFLDFSEPFPFVA